jgi:hypothetical protein
VQVGERGGQVVTSYLWGLVNMYTCEHVSMNQNQFQLSYLVRNATRAGSHWRSILLLADSRTQSSRNREGRRSRLNTPSMLPTTMSDSPFLPIPSRRSVLHQSTATSLLSSDHAAVSRTRVPNHTPLRCTRSTTLTPHVAHVYWVHPIPIYVRLEPAKPQAGGAAVGHSRKAGSSGVRSHRRP